MPGYDDFLESEMERDHDDRGRDFDREAEGASERADAAYDAAVDEELGQRTDHEA